MTSNLTAGNRPAANTQQHKRKHIAIALITASFLLLSTVLGAVFVGASSRGINNNGTAGVSIDIYGPYYKALAKETSSAYARGGCAWYASSRASELVDRHLGVHSPANWWESIAAQNGFRKSSAPVAKGFAIYSNHMVVIEKIDGDVVTISEGSNPGASDAAHGYCAIRQLSLSSLKSAYKGQSFKGFIDLGVRSDNPPIADTVPDFHGSVYVAKGSADNKWHSYRGESPDVTYTGVAEGKYGWWRVVKGDLDWNADSIYPNEHGWWKVTGGKVDFEATGVYPNEHGWWRVLRGKVDFSFNGLATNENGTWYIRNGKVDFSYTGEYDWEGTLYTVTTGKAEVK